MIKIGRDIKSNIVIPASFDTVSFNHATIREDRGHMILEDHSSNGTLVNGKKFHNQKVEIYPGDRIMLAGSYQLPWAEIDQIIEDRGQNTSEGKSRSTERFDPNTATDTEPRGPQQPRGARMNASHHVAGTESVFPASDNKHTATQKFKAPAFTAKSLMSCLGALVVLCLIGWVFFDDLIRQIL